MTKRFISVWSDGHRPRTRVAVTNAATDTESGTEGTDDLDASLRALKVMLDRGLIGADDYDRRRRSLLAERSADGNGC